MSISSSDTTNAWWRQLRSRLTILYLCFALALLAISAAGQVRLLNEVGKTFGGFFWAIVDKEVVSVSTPPQLAPLEFTRPLLDNAHITTTNRLPGSAGLTSTYQHAHSGDPITYSVTYTTLSTSSHSSFIRPAAVFTLDMWWQSYGLPLLAGISWLVVGVLLLATASDWNGAVEGLTLLPAAMVLLLYCHWGNVQQAYVPDIVVQLLWTPAFALLGAVFIHLGLLYRPQTLRASRTPSLMVDALPYLPLIALVAYEWSSFLIFGHVPTRINLLASLGYGAIGCIVGFGISLSPVHLILLLGLDRREDGTVINPIPEQTSRRILDMLVLRLIGAILCFWLIGLPILQNGQPLLPLSVFYILAVLYPLVLLYAIRKLRLLERLQVALEQRDEGLSEQRKRMDDLLQTTRELQRATSILLRADAHLRSTLSQRIHDQPKQQALRIRSLLGHWQHKLRVEAERDPEGKVTVQPIIEALSKVRKISEELEDDLGGLQLLVEDAYQRRSLGLKLHLEKLIREDLPALHPESPLKVRADLWALDALSPDLEETVAGARIAEAISYTVTQALLNVYNHAGASFATVRTLYSNGVLEVSIIDDGRGFDPHTISPEKTSLFKAQLKAREAEGTMSIQSSPRPQEGHGTTLTLRLPIPPPERRAAALPQTETEPETKGIKEDQDIQTRL